MLLLYNLSQCCVINSRTMFLIFILPHRPATCNRPGPYTTSFYFGQCVFVSNFDFKTKAYVLQCGINRWLELHFFFFTTPTTTIQWTYTKTTKTLARYRKLYLILRVVSLQPTTPTIIMIAIKIKKRHKRRRVGQWC